MKPAVTIVKIGGAIIDEAVDLGSFLQQFADVKGLKILVHGGGKGASDLLRTLKLRPQLVQGRRITDAATLEVVTMFYAGKINKQLVAALQALGVNSLGLSGADGNLIRTVKRPVREVDYGFVGDVDAGSVNAPLLRGLLTAGSTPVLCPITHDGHGQLLNTNADTIAAAVAAALAPHFTTTLHYCFDKKGVLADAQDDGSVIAQLTPDDYAHLTQQGVITDGMLPKLNNAFAAVNAGVETVIIGHALHLHGPQQTRLCRS